MAKSSDVPVFGPLSSLKVLSVGSAIAVPFAAMLMAEFGADVIQVESALSPDSIRVMKYWWAQEHRNMRDLALDIGAPEGKEIFLQLIQWADIWMESSKGGTYEKWGLSDEVIWQHNPRLVIVHVSGFGQSGVPEYVSRGSLDSVGQAFSGIMYLNGLPEPNPPQLSNPMACDYFTAMNTCWSALAAYIKARETGEGDSIDVSQYESGFKVQGCYPMMFLNDGYQFRRNGNFNPQVAGIGVWKARDGKYVSMMIAGGNSIKNMKPMLGLADDPDFPDTLQMAPRGTPLGNKLEEAITALCQAHTAEELQKMFAEAKVPAQVVYDYQMIAEDPHYQARQDIIEWEDFQYGKVKGVGVFPKFKKNPGMIWRSAPLYGMDNEDILKELGCDDQAIQSFYEKRVIAKKTK